MFPLALFNLFGILNLSLPFGLPFATGDVQFYFFLPLIDPFPFLSTFYVSLLTFALGSPSKFPVHVYRTPHTSSHSTPHRTALDHKHRNTGTAPQHMHRNHSTATHRTAPHRAAPHVLARANTVSLLVTTKVSVAQVLR